MQPACEAAVKQSHTHFKKVVAAISARLYESWDFRCGLQELLT